jgi:putative ABC transport system permease protein
MLTDLRLSARTLVRSPGFAGAAILTLALGIAANITVFTFVDAVLLRPMPFADPERVVDLGRAAYLDLLGWRTVATLSDVAGVQQGSVQIGDEDRGPERYPAAYVTANTFALIGHRPVRGRDFRPEDDRAGAPPVVLIGYSIWRSRYGGDESVVGRTVRVNGVPATVIGVMPERFGFPQIARAWLPLSMHPAVRARSEAAQVQAIGRMQPFVTPSQIHAELDALRKRLTTEYPEREHPPVGTIESYRAGISSRTPAATAFLLMLGAVGFVLLIACANVANLMLVRASSRANDISVRIALGAGRWQVVRLLLSASVLLAVTAGVIALVLARAGVALIARAIDRTGDAPYWLDFTVDTRIFVFFAAVCLGTAVLSGLAPAWLATARRTASHRTIAGGRQHRRWTGGFVVAQLALSLVLLSGAGAVIRSVLAQIQATPGIETTGLVTMRIELTGANYRQPEARSRFYESMTERVSQLAGAPTAFAGQIPLGRPREVRLVTDANPDLRDEQQPRVGRMVVSANYFDVVGADVVRGRRFARSESGPVVIINQRLASMYFDRIDPVGRRLRMGGANAPSTPDSTWFTIVGVAENIRQASTEGGDFDPVVYLNYQHDPETTTLAIARSSLAPGAVARAIGQQMNEVDRDLALFDVGTVDDRIADLQWGQRFAASLLGVFAAIALLLAAVGLYAVTAYASQQRTREIGIRIALGATAAHVWWTITRGAAAQLVLGLMLGMVGGFFVARALPSQLTGVSGVNADTFAAVAALLALVGSIASLLPGRRAVRVDPVVSLRSE